MTRLIKVPRAAKAALMGLMVAGLGACTIDNVLDVINPDEIDENALNDITLANVLANGVIADFQTMYDDPFVWRGSFFTDMQITGINWEQTARLSQRIVQFDEGDAARMFAAISLARQQADSVAGLLKNLLESPSTDVRLARTLAYAGYSYIILADAMCRATINQQAEIYEPPALYEFAITRFNEAVTIATASGADDIFTLAQVGLSRANLNLGNMGAAMAAATLVPDDFMFFAEYNSTNSQVYNVLEGRESGSNHSLGMHPRFLAGGAGNDALFGTQDLDAFLTDPRIQHSPSWTFGHNVLTMLYKPRQGLMHSGYNGETFATGGSPPLWQRGTDIAFASGLEARHNFWEATGPTAATLDFVNERRAFGNQDPVTLTGAALMTELHDQRGRDLFLAGNRLGDLRRWMRGGENLFPTGLHPTEQWGQYGSATCFPLPLDECEGNTNLSVSDCHNP